MRIDDPLQIAPYDARLHCNLFVDRIQLQYLIEFTHVDVQTVLSQFVRPY